MTSESASRDNARRRARIGVVALAVRSSAQIVLSFAAMLILARLLKPADFGIFAIAQFSVTLLGLFGNVGFGPALIQRNEAPTQRELATIWWAQLALSMLVVPALLVFSTLVRRIWIDLPQTAEPLLRVLAISFLFNTLRIVPTILLERELRFVPLAIIELASSVTYFGIAVGVAYAAGDVSALVYAVVAQSIVGCVLVYVAMPWRPTFEFDVVKLKAVARYGAAFQGNVFIGFANNAVAPLLIGIVLGKVALGLNGFAQTLAWLPLRLVEIVGRVGFPLYSRLRDDRPQLARELRMNVQLCGIATALCSGLLFVVGGPAIEWVYGAKWQAAVPLLQVYSSVMLLGFVSPIASALFSSFGRPGLMFRLALGWTVVNWLVVGLAMSLAPSLMVYSLAYSVHVVVGNLVVLVLVRRMLPDARIGRSVAALVAAATVTASVGQWLVTPRLHEGWQIGVAAAACCTTLVALAATFDRSLLSVLRAVFSVGRRRETP